MARSLPGSRESSSPSPYWYWLGLDDRKEPEGASFVYADWPDSFPFLWPPMDISKFSSFRAGKDWISEAREPGSPSLPETGAYSPWHESDWLTREWVTLPFVIKICISLSYFLPFSLMVDRANPESNLCRLPPTKSRGSRRWRQELKERKDRVLESLSERKKRFRKWSRRSSFNSIEWNHHWECLARGRLDYLFQKGSSCRPNP